MPATACVFEMNHSMYLPNALTTFLAHRTFDRVLRELPRHLETESERAALAAFRRAARSVPRYRALLASAGVDPARVRSIEDFRRVVPLCDKEAVFGHGAVRDWCVNGRWPERSTLVTSSGYSGAFSFSLETPRQAARVRLGVDVLLDRYFDVASRRTLLLNVLPCVRVPSALAIMADVGPRVDAALATLRYFGPECEQVIVVAEPLLLKALVDAGVEHGIDWRTHRVHVVTGGDFFPENLRAYVRTMLGHSGDGERGRVLTSFGISEIALSLAHETPELQRLRGVLHDQPARREALFPGSPCTPSLLAYFPAQYHVETPVIAGRPRLVVTTLDTDRPIPLIRYDTGDHALMLSAAELRSRLGRVGLAAFAPVSPLPVLAVFGRGRSRVIGGRHVFPEQIKEALYADSDVASLCTGYFAVDADRDEGLHVRAQLKRRCAAGPEHRKRFEHWLEHYTGARARVDFLDYFRFEEGLDGPRQRKSSGL